MKECTCTWMIAVGLPDRLKLALDFYEVCDLIGVSRNASMLEVKEGLRQRLQASLSAGIIIQGHRRKLGRYPLDLTRPGTLLKVSRHPLERIKQIHLEYPLHQPEDSPLVSNLMFSDRLTTVIPEPRFYLEEL